MSNDALAIIAKRIYLSFKPLRIVKSIAIVNGKVVYAGDQDRSIRIARELGGDVVNYRTSVIMPGFVDSHLHMDGIGAFKNGVDLRRTRSIQDVINKIRSFIEEDYSGGVVWGRGWDHEFFREQRIPSRRDLDKASRDIPIIIFRLCGHLAVLNTQALEEALRIAPQDVVEKFFIKDSSGEFTGVVIEDAVQLLWNIIKDSIDLRKAIVEASRLLASHGVTSVGFMSVDAKTLKTLWKVEREGMLRTRVYIYLNPDVMHKIIDAGLGGGWKSDLISLKGVKFFVDGSLGARTAYLSSEYEDDKSSRGRLLVGYEELAEEIKNAWENGFQTAVHAIGDAAIDEVLKAYRESGVPSQAIRIEHASILRDEHIRFLSKEGIGVSIQPMFRESDWWAKRRVGDRVKILYRFKTMVKAGVKMGISTDAPVESINPWDTIIVALKEQSLSENVYGEPLSRVEALDLYTRGSGELMDQNIGTLYPGCYADFIVLDKDPLFTSVKELNRLPQAVYLGGIRIF